MILSGCSNSITDAIKGTSFFSTSDDSLIALISNSSLVGSNQCVQTNQIKIKISIPSNQDYQCSDLSELPTDEKPGLICEGGVSVLSFPVSGELKSCNQLTLCGLPPTSRTALDSRFDGKVEELVFDNLPWGCSGKIKFGPKIGFDSKSQIFTTKIRTPSCPFCTTTNSYTCLPCPNLGANEKIVAGQVILDTCGGACASCNVGGVVTAHGAGRDFYLNSSAQCGQTCEANKKYRVCNNGNFESFPSYQHPQCLEVPCGCQIPGTTVTFDSGKIMKLYQRETIQCGTVCNSVDVRCENGSWLRVSNSQALSAQDLETYNLQNCVASNTCRCTLPATTSGGFINSNSSRNLFKIDTTTCDAPTACSDANNFTKVTCDKDGQLSPFDDQTFKFTSCRIPTCQCSYGGVKIDRNTTVYFYKKEVADEGETCDSISAPFECTGEAKLVGSEKLTNYPFISCQSENDSGTLGGTGGGTGNDEGPGAALRSRFGLGDGGGGPGIPCVDGARCRQNIHSISFPNIRRNNCELPWGNAEIEYYGSIIAFSRTCVVSPQKCSDYRQSRTCFELGKLSGSDTFKYHTCEEKTQCP